MLPFDDPQWSTLTHAYGTAADIPLLLAKAGKDTRPDHEPGSTWFQLWSALCHQGDTYTASYAAMPHLVALAPSHLKQKRYDALLLAACIELARLEGRGPTIPPQLTPSYTEAIDRGRSLAETNLPSAWDQDSEVAIRASAAALGGDITKARALLDADLEEDQRA